MPAVAIRSPSGGHRIADDRRFIPIEQSCSDGAITRGAMMMSIQADMTYQSQEQAGNTGVLIVFYIDECLTEKSKKHIQNQLLTVAGIADLEFDSYRPHPLLVRHSASLIKANDILRRLDDLNLNAQLIVGI